MTCEHDWHDINRDKPELPTPVTTYIKCNRCKLHGYRMPGSDKVYVYELRTKALSQA